MASKPHEAEPKSDPKTDPADDSVSAVETVQKVENTEDGGDAPVTQDTKAAFAAALERKKQAAHTRTAHLDTLGGVGGATANHKATRTFRRKSG